MRLVVQRVTRASVSVAGREVSSIGPGLMVLVGVKEGDSEKDAEFCAQKIAQMRIFKDEEDKMNLSLLETGGEVLLISQFTLLGDVRKGRRPSFIAAEEPGKADALYLLVANILRAQGITVGLGEFGANMQVALVNDGPVTILLDSGREF